MCAPGAVFVLHLGPNPRSKAMNSEIQEALLRLPQVLQLIPVSRSAWWAGVKSGKYPASVKLGERTTCWRKSDILALIETIAG